jgi:hypothetical protein
VAARAAVGIQWHEAEDVKISFGRGHQLTLSPSNKASNIDYVVAHRDELQSELPELCEKIERYIAGQRKCCSWSEVRDVMATGVEIGAHSVTHVDIAQVSSVRRQFEIAECKKLCELMLGPCQAFAYPFGREETHSLATRLELERAGYSTAFLTHSEFITAKSDRLTLPRITIPDGSVPLGEFEAHASGVSVAMRRLKTLGRPERILRA